MKNVCVCVREGEERTSVSVYNYCRRLMKGDDINLGSRGDDYAYIYIYTYTHLHIHACVSY